MKREDVPDPILTYELRLLAKDGTETRLTVLVGRPYVVDAGEARCPIQLRGLDPRYPDIAGSHVFQAMHLALALAARRLQHQLEKGSRLFDAMGIELNHARSVVELLLPNGKLDETRCGPWAPPGLDELADLADSFCVAVDGADATSPGEQLDAIHLALAEVYAAALHLPTSFGDGEDDDAPHSSETQQPSRAPDLSRLAEHLGERRYYREVFDAYRESEADTVTGDLIDDFIDIYADLQRGLRYWTARNPRAALWEWRFHFGCHWGEHATSALRALYALAAWHDGRWPTR